MTGFEKFVSDYISGNDLTDDQLNSKELFGEIKDAYVDSITESIGSKSMAKLQATGEFVNLKDKRVLADFNLSIEDEEKPSPKNSLIDFVLSQESDEFVPDDKGLASKFGVRQDAYSDFLGQDASADTIKNLTRDDAIEFYSHLYDQTRIGEIESDQVKSVVFDGVVNHGPTGMGNIVQDTLNDQFNQGLIKDGVIGSDTITALNNSVNESNDFAVLSTLSESRRSFYETLDDFDVNGDGWNKRIDEIISFNNASQIQGEAADTPEIIPQPQAQEQPELSDEALDNTLHDVFQLQTTVRDEEEKGFAENAARAVGRGVLKGFSDIPRFIGHLVESDNIKGFADSIDEIIDAPDGEFAQSTTGQIFNGLGQVGGLIVGGVGTASAKVGGRLVAKFGSKEAAEKAIVKKLDAVLFPGASGFASGGVEQVNDYYNTVRERGEEVDESVEKTALFLGGAVGTLESILPGKIINTGYVGKFTQKFNETFSGSRIRSAAGAAIIEGGTEAAQSVLHDVIGNALYDADPEIGEAINDAINEGTVGASVGAIIGVLLPKGIRKAGGTTPDTVVDNTSIESTDASEFSADDPTQVGERPAPDDSSLSGGDPGQAIDFIENIEVAQSSPESSAIPAPSQVFDIASAYDVGIKNGDTELYKQQTFATYERMNPEFVKQHDIQNYDDLINKSEEVAKKEIDKFLDVAGVDFVRGKEYRTVTDIRNDLNKNRKISVGRTDVGGLLDEIAIPEGNITYGEILNGLENLSRIKANVDFGYTSDLKAYNVVDSLFSDLAKVSVSTHLQGRIAHRYTSENNLRIFETIRAIEREEESTGKSFTKAKRKAYESLSRSPTGRFVLPAQHTIGLSSENQVVPSGNESISDESKRAREKFVSLSEPKKDITIDDYIESRGGGLLVEDRSFADVILPFNQRVEQRPPGILKTLNEKLTYGLLNKRDRKLDKVIRDALGVKGASQFESQHVRKYYQSKRDEFANSERGKDFVDITSSVDPETQIKNSMDDVVTSIFQGELTLIKKDIDRLPTPENVVTDSNGDYLGEILGSEIAVPKEMIEAIGSFAVITDKHRQNILDNIEFQQEQIDNRINDISVQIQSNVLKIVDDVNKAGITNSEFVAFSDADWVKNVRDGSNPKFAYINSALTQYFKRISEKKIKEGFDAKTYSPESLENKFYDAASSSENISQFIENTGGAFGTRDTIDIEPIIALGGHVESNSIQSLFSSIQKEQDTIQHLKSTRDFFDKIKSNPLHISRSYRAYEEPLWYERMVNPRTDAEKARKDKFKNELIRSIADKKYDGKITGAAIQEAESTLNDIVTSVGNRNTYNNTNGHVFDGAEFAGSALLKRGDLSDAYREFLGEYTDPETQMQATVNRIARASYQSMLHNQLYSKFIGNGLYTEEQRAALTQAEQNALVTVSLPQQFNLFKNQVFYATPVMANTLNSLNEGGVLEQAPLKLFNMVSADFKKFNTLYSLQSASANIISGLTTNVMTGGFADKNAFAHAKVAYVDIIGALRDGDADTIRDIVEKVGGSEANVQDILRHQTFGKSIPGKILDWTQRKVPIADQDTISWVGAPFDTASKIMMDVYALGDLGPKIFAYQFNKELLSKKLGMSEENASNMAAEIVRKTAFDYHEVPQIVKQIRDIPFTGGGFLSWSSLTFSTAYNSGKVVLRMADLESNKWGIDNIPNYDPNNPNHIARARTGFFTSGDFATSITAIKSAGFFMGLAMPMILASAGVAVGRGMGMLFDDDDQDQDLYGRNGKGKTNEDLSKVKSAMNALVPDYYKNTEKLLVDFNERGNLEWINVSRITNYGNLNEAMNALFDENVPDENTRLANMMGVLFGDYFAEGFGVQFYNNIRNNQDKFGNPIFSEDDNAFEVASSSLKFLATEVYVNSSFKTIDNQVDAWLFDAQFNENTGEPVEAMDTFMRLAGLRKIEFDAKHELSKRAYTLRQRNTDATKVLSSTLRGFRGMSDSEILDAIVKRKNVYEKMIDRAEIQIQASRDLGLTDNDIRAAYKGNLKKADVNKLLRGKRPVLSLEKLGDSASSRLELKGLTDEAKNIFRGNYDRARELLNNL